MAARAPFVTFQRMDDRHYVCPNCGLKWFVPASRAQENAALHCGECGAPLIPRDALGGEVLAVGGDVHHHVSHG